jgi:beta-glucanase (GH16 family)
VTVPGRHRTVLPLLALAAVLALAVFLATALIDDPKSTPQPRAVTSSSPTTPAATTAPPAATGPPAAPPGWRTLWQDDFNGAAIDGSRWFRYSGQPSEGPGAWWEPSHVSPGGGLLVLRGAAEAARGGQLVTGGLNSSPGQSYAYGRYLVRMRVAAAADMAYAVLLVSPRSLGGGYVVIASDDGGDRGAVHAGLRTRSLSGAPFAIDRTTRVDLTDWHTVGVDWSPRELRYTLDGRTWATVKSPLVPSTPLALAVQTQAVCSKRVRGKCLATSGTPIDLQVDWVSVLAREGAG